MLGVRYGAMADSQTMQYFASRLPRDAQWTAFGIGRMAFPMLAQAWLLGGHVRIGMEDTVYLDRGSSRGEQRDSWSKKAVGIVRSLGGHIATAAEARAMLELPDSTYVTAMIAVTEPCSRRFE